ncbi:hypothetical protein BJ741DRAFT_615899, partial [Chytriomyces cf. hyalinus JEL632]
TTTETTTTMTETTTTATTSTSTATTTTATTTTSTATTTTETTSTMTETTSTTTTFTTTTSTGTTSTSTTSTTTALGAAYYPLKVAGWSLTARSNNSAITQGTSLVIDNYSTDTASLFTLSSKNVLIHKASGLCVATVPVGGSYNGVTLTLQSCTNPYAAPWVINNNVFKIVVPLKGAYCMDLYGEYTNSGNKIQVYSCTNKWNQKWELAY